MIPVSDSSIPKIPPVIVPPGEGKVVCAFGSEMIFHLTGEQTGGRLTLATIVATPHDDGPPLHYHDNEDETFLVQEGRMSFVIDGKWRVAGAGTIVFAPKGSVRTLKNIGNPTARILVSIAPSGFEIFYARCAEESLKPGGPDMARIVQISTEYGIHYV